ncbi:MAG: hypothetical protein JSW52_08065 [Candidatus Coatesbacteria bacterium]|nr:MAG: hypothetical protein JSW52_08065 [Candidatus Coatesbacteria bacterium]
MRTIFFLTALGLAAFAPAAAISYVTVSDDAGFTVELPEGFEIASEVAEDPVIRELTEGKPSVVSTYVWEGSELEGMGFAVVRIGGGGVAPDKMESFVHERLNAEMMPYKVTDLGLTHARITEIGADSGNSVQYTAEIEEMVLKVNVYYLQKGNASYLVIIGWPLDAGFAGAGQHIEKTFKLE